jgi:hypothetical protein
MLMRSHKQTHLTCVIYRERESDGEESERDLFDHIWSYLSYIDMVDLHLQR